MTFREAREFVERYKMVIRKTAWGDYRVNYRHGLEVTACYSDDLQDAVDTAIAMSVARYGARYCDNCGGDLLAGTTVCSRPGCVRG